MVAMVLIVEITDAADLISNKAACVLGLDMVE